MYSHLVIKSDTFIMIINDDMDGFASCPLGQQIPTS